MTNPSISDLTNQLKELTQSLESGGGGDFKMSEAAHKKYTQGISEYRAALKEYLNKATALADYGLVGSFPSAVQTKIQLADQVTPAAVTSLDLYIAYLEQLENAVNAAFQKMQAEDQAT